MTRSDRISANVGRLLAAWDAAAGKGPSLALNNLRFAKEVAVAIEDAVDKAERERKGIPPKEV